MPFLPQGRIEGMAYIFVYENVHQRVGDNARRSGGRDLVSITLETSFLGIRRTISHERTSFANRAMIIKFIK
jgi:hypothetical protein